MKRRIPLEQFISEKIITGEYWNLHEKFIKINKKETTV